VLDKYVLWVKKTKDIKNSRTEITVEELKEMLLRERAVNVRDALKEINQRTIQSQKVTRPQI
jgi:hypothetical protein